MVYTDETYFITAQIANKNFEGLLLKMEYLQEERIMFNFLSN